MGMIIALLKAASTCAGRMRPEEAVINPFFLMRQFDRAPHHASTRNAQQS